MEQWKSEVTHHLKNCCFDSTLYTYRGDSILNYGLRNNYIPHEVLPIYNSMIDLLQKVPFFPQQTLYRGIKSEIYSDLNVGDIIADHGFSSFTLDKSVARKFLNPGMKGTILILNDYNQKAIFFSKQYGTSKFDEDEVLLGPGSVFKIVKKEVVINITLLYITHVDNIIPDYQVIPIKDKLLYYHKKIIKYKVPILIGQLFIYDNFDLYEDAFNFFQQYSDKPALWLNNEYIFVLYKLAQEQGTDIHYVIGHNADEFSTSTRKGDIYLKNGEFPILDYGIDGCTIDDVMEKLNECTIERKTIVTHKKISFLNIFTNKFENKAVKAIYFRDKVLLTMAINSGISPDYINTEGDESLLDLCIKYDFTDMALELIKHNVTINPKISRANTLTARLLNFVLFDENIYQYADNVNYLIECPQILEYYMWKTGEILPQLLIDKIFDFSEYVSFESALLSKREAIKILIMNNYIPSFDIDMLLVITNWSSTDTVFLNKILELNVNIENPDYIYNSSLYSLKYINMISNDNHELVSEVFRKNIYENYNIIKHILTVFSGFKIYLEDVKFDPSENPQYILEWISNGDVIVVDETIKN